MSLDNRGGSYITTILYIIIAVLVIYVVIKIVPPYMDYYAMEDEVTHQLHLSQINEDTVILHDLYSKVEELGLPIEEGDITMTNNEDGSINISMQWETEVDFGYGVRKVYEFEINANSKAAKD